MSANNQQAVVDGADTQAMPGSEAGQDARNQVDDLDALLSQWPEPPAKPAADPPPPAAAVQQPEVAALKAQMDAFAGRVAEVEQIKFKADMGATIKDIRGELDPNVLDDGLVESWLDFQARQDPRLAQAWAQRDANPAQFRRVKVELGKKLAKQFGRLPDPAATEDRNAVTAAVRGSSTKAPAEPVPNYSGMSNAEYREAIKKEHGFDPGVG